MIETALLATFVYFFGWHCGRIHRDCQLARKTAEGINALVRSEWYGEQSRGGVLHLVQDVTGELPRIKAIVRFGPEEPRWWMQYVRRAG